MNLIKSRLGAVAVGATIIAVVGGGSAVAASQITSAQIKDQTIRSRDIATAGVGTSEIRDGNVNVRDLSSQTKGYINDHGGKDGAPGSKGDTGPAGSAGANGSNGAKGDTGMAQVTTHITDPNSTLGGLNVVPVPGQTGARDTDTTLLTFTLNKGTYLINGTAQFFHFVSTGTDGVDYGVISLLVSGRTDRGTAFTADIPGDGTNGAQTNANTYLTIPSDNTTLKVVGSIRPEGNGNGPHISEPGQAGAQVIVTQVS